MSPARLCILLACLLATALATPASAAGPAQGAQRIKYRFGPLHVTPGQNTIDYAPAAQGALRPDVPGYITRFKPDLEYANGSKPSVTVLHLHHGVWLIGSEPRFAVGEEKTITDLPDGFGYRYLPQQRWLINYMIHNLTQTPSDVYITYTIDFVPDTAPAAATMTAVHTKWMDVAGLRTYPVFDAKRGTGKKGRLTFPDDVPDDPAVGPANTWTVTSPTTLVSTAGHLHPGGLSTYLTVTRGDRTRRIFTSHAKYWEPAGAVSWDVAMEGTPDDWRVALQPGDVVKLHAVYDVSKASWYESMGISPIAIIDNRTQGKDPFDTTLNMKGALTHGRLKENRENSGRFTGLPNPVKTINGPGITAVTIQDFLYGQGDLTLGGKAGRPPVIPPGGTLKFTNQDAFLPENGGIFHTITACKLPCNGSAGIGYPLANGPVDFDSGQLGFGPGLGTAAANRESWTTPATLKPGTYSYFCRVHPFMRGAFRVAKKAS
ncbi:MAG: hypothetical protein ACJ762_11115 [Solirubrobacteraceae bacterium]